MINDTKVKEAINGNCFFQLQYFTICQKLSGFTAETTR